MSGYAHELTPHTVFLPQYDYENAGAIKQNDRRKEMTNPKEKEQPGSHYINSEVLGSHASQSKPVLFGGQKK